MHLQRPSCIPQPAGDASFIPFVDMHTAGEPVRIVDAREWDVDGTTLLERRHSFLKRYDSIRKMLMREPRGHADMYGAVLLPPTDSKSTAGVIFTHVSGYSTMCGHATIALGRYFHDLLGSTDKSTFIFECPCGPVTAMYAPDAHGVGITSFENVRSIVTSTSASIHLPSFGVVKYSISFGGAYYAILPARSFGLELSRASLADLAQAAGELVSALRAADLVRHPNEPTLGFLYGAILTEHDHLDLEHVNKHYCWFGEGQVDRSPTGSGVSARLALALNLGQSIVGRDIRFAGLSGQEFIGRVTDGNDHHVGTSVSGRAYYTGFGTMVAETGDPFGEGFIPAMYSASPRERVDQFNLSRTSTASAP